MFDFNRQYIRKGSEKVELEIKIGVALFTYDRPHHTQKVLEGLKKNNITSIYVFQDGLKNLQQKENWLRVNELIKNIDWCDVKFIESKYNKGVAQSIITGINYVFKENEAIIVLEDDCIPEYNFLEFMSNCFLKYKENKKIMSINGYAWSIDIDKEYEYDIYFSYTIGTWGWGTWKDRWSNFEIDYTLIREINKDETAKQRLKLAGTDNTEIFKQQLLGETDSWAIFWALQIIKNNGVTITPKYSLVSNIGLDGTGIHCGYKKENIIMNKNSIPKMIFPEEIKIDINILKTISMEFEYIPVEKRLGQYNDLLKQWVQKLYKGFSVKEYFYGIRGDIFIYGRGEITDLLEVEIKIKGIIIEDVKDIDNEHKNIILIEDSNKITSDAIIIIIPIYDEKRIRRNLLKCGCVCQVVTIAEVINSIGKKYDA